MKKARTKDGLSALLRRFAAGGMTLCMAASALPTAAEAAAVKEHSVRPLTAVNDISYNETTADTHDPYRGFYHAKQINFTRDMKNCDKVEDALNEITGWVGPKRVKKNEEEFYLVHLRIDLSDFSKGPDHGSDAEINAQNDDVEAALRKLLDGLRASGQTAIIRFAYDKSYEGVTSGSSRSVWEPENNSTILQHQKKVGAVLNEYTDVIACLETGIIGPWGEMHGSSRDSMEPVQLFVQKWLDVLDDDITVNVRRPEHYCWYLGKNKDQTKEMLKNMSDTSYKTTPGQDQYRVGVFNDGYLGSASDRGTFVGDRDQEIAWLSTQAKHTLYGGEIAAWHASEDDGSKNVSPKNNVDYMTQESFLTHTTYLNKGWNETVTDVFRADDYKTGSSSTDEKRDPVYLKDGIKQYDYLRNHMGYRFVVKGVELTKETTVYENFSIETKIENVGFANMVKDEKASLILKGSNGYTKEYDLSDLDARIGESATNYDPRNWNSGKDINNKGVTYLTATVDIPDNFPTGDYKAYLKIAYNKKDQEQAEYPVHFANEGTNVFDSSLNANFLGNFKIVEGTKESDSSSKASSSSSSKASSSSSSKAATVSSSSKKPVASSSKAATVSSSSKKPVASSSKAATVSSSSKKPVASSSKAATVSSSSKKPAASSSKAATVSSSSMKPVASSSKAATVSSSSKKPVASSSKAATVSSSSKKPVASSTAAPDISPMAESSIYEADSSSFTETSSVISTDDTSSYTESDTSSAADIVCGTEHRFGEWTVKEKPTCIAEGTEVRVCEICGTEEERDIPALGHDEELIFEDLPENGHDGNRLYVCRRCGTARNEVIPWDNTDQEGSDAFMRGDVDGSGEINVTDISLIAAHIKGIKPLDPAALKRADVNNDGDVNVTDISTLAAHIKGIKPLG